MPTTENKRGIFALMVAHCAGMLDLVALPIWVGTLVSQYRFDPQQAGGLATLFLIGASLASVFFAPRFTHGKAKWAAVCGFGIAALAFLLSSRSTAFPALAGLHFIGGIAAGTALSFTHGTIGHAGNPHRLFAHAGLAIGIFGIIFLGGTPGLVEKFGGPALFVALATVMAVATITTLMFFPKRTRHLVSGTANSAVKLPPLGSAVWCSIIAVAFLAMTQAMTLSFFERIGMARGFGVSNVTFALVIYGIVTLFPAPLAAFLERRVAATTVICSVPILQFVFAMIVSHTSNYVLFAASGALMAFTIIFTHTFAFGLLARLDPTGRAVAGTPAMLMVGAAVGPFLGGSLVKFIGFEAIGYAAFVLVALELVLFNMTRRALVPSASLRSAF
ncbi:MFS transporter [Noviherbaspirillum saxi]|uniref:MFS transporter n=1 Tax=Noviherbaspirillum saxi TaxID=2320863 RepID=A0A3A3FKC4_9BURK|nr:MFS transporter [Noviherbaspirillum saxi]RJF95171.1 MFS transporter [Noviherbaspirillum saxi]